MSPSLQTMGFFMSDINFCNTKEQLNHLGEVVTGKVDGSPTGADIDTSTLPYTGQVRKTLPALEGEYEQSITDKEAEADAAIDAYRLLNKGPYAAGITLESKFEFITYNGESYFATNPPYTTTATTPDADGNLFIGSYQNQSQVRNEISSTSVVSFNNISECVAGIVKDGSSIDHSVGNTYVIEDYYGGLSPSNSGVLFFKVVTAGSGVDDGGKYIDIDANFQLMQNLPTPFNPKHWGAYGNGVNDDYESTQSCIDYASSVTNQNKEVYGGGCDYLIGSKLTLGNQASAFGVRFTNLNLRAKSDIGTGNYLLESETSNVTFSMCNFYMGYFCSGVLIPEATLGVTFLKCRFQNPSNYGCYISGTGGHDHTFLGCYFDRSNQATQEGVGIQCDSPDIIVSDCTFKWFSNGAIFSYGGVQFTGNHVYQGKANPDTSLLSAGVIFGFGDFVCTDNYIDNCKIKISNNTSKVESWSINDNQFYGSREYTANDSWIEFATDGTDIPLKNGEITNNKFNNAYGSNTTPNLRIASKTGSGTFDVGSLSCYENKTKNTINNGTRFKAMVTIPSGDTSKQAIIPPAAFPFGEYRYLQTSLTTNPNLKTLTTSAVSYALGEFLFKLDSTDTADRIAAVELISDVDDILSY